jgi:small subunit ribosomal protein S4
MSRITQDTKCRLCRAEGTKLYLKGARCLSAKCPIEKKGAVIPGMHGGKRAKKPTDYGIQLRAKQKAKRIYGVQETQFKNYYLQAKTQTGMVGDNLLVLLEIRLDNVVYAAGLATSRSHAKQLVSHGHVQVNGKRITVPSYSLKLNDTITIDKSAINVDVLPAQAKEFTAPSWLVADVDNLTIKIQAFPLRQDIKNDIDENLIVEYYSR